MSGDVLELRPLTRALGVEAIGLDLTRAIAPAAKAALRAAFVRSHLVLVRGGCLAMQAQRDFASLFGPVIDSAYVSNSRPDGIISHGALLFHSDLAFTPHPYLGLSLHAIELPSSGSSTYFVDAVAAYRALPLSLRDRVRDLTATHAFDLETQRGDSQAYREPVPEHAERARHRVALTHPVTGDSVLYVNEMQTERINELDRKDSDELIGALFAHLYSGDFTYEHRWQVGDLIVWDNVAVQHARRDPAGAARTLQRVTLAEIDPLASWKRDRG